MNPLQTLAFYLSTSPTFQSHSIYKTSPPKKRKNQFTSNEKEPQNPNITYHFLQYFSKEEFGVNFCLI